MDRSGSIAKNDPLDNKGQNWENIKQFMVQFYQQVIANDNDDEERFRFAVVMFDGDVHTEILFRDDQEDLEDRLSSLDYGDPDAFTNTADGIEEVYSNVFTLAKGHREGTMKYTYLDIRSYYSVCIAYS